MDLYTWSVTYDDGSCIAEYDDAAPDGHGFADVDLSRARKLQLFPSSNVGPIAYATLPLAVSAESTIVEFYLPCLPIHTVLLPPLARPIFFRRRSIALMSDDERKYSTIHCIGYQETVHGHNMAVYHFIAEDGSSTITNDYQAV